MHRLVGAFAGLTYHIVGKSHVEGSIIYTIEVACVVVFVLCGGFSHLAKHYFSFMCLDPHLN